MLSRVIQAILLICLSGYCFSQPYKNQKSVIARFNFPGLIDPLDHNLSFGGEYIFHPKFSAGADAAWIFASNYISRTRRTDGMLLRPFLRYYPQGKPELFFQVEGHYKGVNYTVEDWVGKNLVNGVPSYEEFERFQYRKRVAGAHLLVGGRHSISKNRKLSIEVNAGLGIRWRKLYASNPDHILSIDELFTRKVTAVLPLNIRFCYRIR